MKNRTDTSILFTAILGIGFLVLYIIYVHPLVMSSENMTNARLGNLILWTFAGILNAYAGFTPHRRMKSTLGGWLSWLLPFVGFSAFFIIWPPETWAALPLNGMLRLGTVMLVLGVVAMIWGNESGRIDFEAELSTPTTTTRTELLGKACGVCRKPVPTSMGVGDTCPHCGSVWGRQQNEVRHYR